jgi:hypothetical protein
MQEYGCLRTQTGIYCNIANQNVYINFTSLEVKSQLPVSEVFLVENNTVQERAFDKQIVPYTLLVYNRAGYWKALYLPKQVADSFYVKLMILDGYNLTYFEKVFDEVHAETSWVKVYKVRWEE